MAELSINMEPSVIESLMYCYTVGEFKKRYLPILNLLNVDKYEYVNTFKHYYDMIGIKVSSGDNELLSVKDADDIIKWLNEFTKKYESSTSEKDKIEFVEEIVGCLQTRNRYISDILNVQSAKKKTKPKDFLIELKMLDPYKDTPEFKPAIAALEENKNIYLAKNGSLGVEQVQHKVIDEQPITDFVSQNKNHQWYDIVSSRSQRLKLFGISDNDLQVISKINSVESFRKCFESVFEKLYQKYDNGHKKRFKNRIGNSLDKAIDRIRKEMNASCDFSDDPEKAQRNIYTLRPFAIKVLKDYCTHRTEKSPNKKAIIAEVVRKLEQAQDK